MAFYVDKKGLESNSGLKKQHQFIVNARTANWDHETGLMKAAGLEVNEARIPADVWRDFDTQTKTLMLSDEGGVLLNDLMPLARNVHIGKIVSEYRRYGADELEVRSSIDGQHRKPVNHVSFDYDGAIVLVHSTQVGRVWRELEGMRSEGYDALLDDQAAATRFVRKRTVDNFVDGTPDLTYKSYQAFGIKNNPNTIALNLGAAGLNVDLTSPTLTFDQAWGAFVAALQALQGQGNNAVGNVTFYISDAIWFNLLRIANPGTNNTETILQGLQRIPGVAGFKRTDTVTGNEFLAIILSSEYIRPVVGMPVTTTPIPRVTPMDDWHVLVWGASGLQVKADAQGRSGVLYASAA
ncbi:major capsid protein [Achromobacter sp. UBA4530]|uniref:major capsid protein n=1 Tax=Achromobacter sp. UBA4530 TaxID=1945912 RepID=UPI00257B0E80|nr:major capsid protein [Achromobacter sp. UBA4530]